MRELLLELLHRLEVVDDAHGELYDSEVREALGMAAFDGFVRPQPGYELPVSFAMYTPAGDRLVQDVLAWFLPAANAEASRAGLGTFHQRLAAFQDSDARTERGNDYEEYFGHSPPEVFDELGELIAEVEGATATQGATPMLVPTAPFLIRTTVLAAVRDGHRLVASRLRPGTGPAEYDVSGLSGMGSTGASWIELYPDALAAQCGWRHRAWGRLIRWSRRRWGGAEGGSFPVEVGAGLAAVEYRALWSGGIEELTISIAANDAATAEAAGAALREMLHPGGVEFD